MGHQEAHTRPGLGHGMHAHPGHGPMGPGAPLRMLAANAIVTQFFARAWMVVSAIALIKIASAMTLNSRVKVMSQLRDDLSDEQRAELMDDIWRRVQRKRCCSAMMNCCKPAEK